MKKIFLFILIFIGIFAAYFAAHGLLYFSFVHFFNIGSVAAKNYLSEILLFLGGSFLISTILSHFKDNVFTRVYYFLSASWLGILTNLFLFFLFALFIEYALNKLGVKKNTAYLGMGAIIGAIIYSIYGAWNAFEPRIKRIEIALKNLPNFWKGKRVVLISDAHFGNIFTERYAHDLTEKISKMNPDMILISGDLFDGTDERLDTFIAPLNKLNAHMGVFYTTGNHETYLEQDISSIVSKTHIKQLKDEMKVIKGLQIIGIDYPPRAEHKDVAKVIKKLKNFDSKKPSILLWHTPTQIKQIKRAGISLQLSGHTHKGQLFPFGLISKIVYKGYDYGLKKDGSFAIYTSSGLGGWGPPMRTEKTSEIVEITLK